MLDSYHKLQSLLTRLVRIHCAAFYTLPQIVLLEDNFGLYFDPLSAKDSSEYTCLVNDRYSPEAIIDLVVQGKDKKKKNLNLRASN